MWHNPTLLREKLEKLEGELLDLRFRDEDDDDYDWVLTRISRVEDQIEDLEELIANNGWPKGEGPKQRA